MILENNNPNNLIELLNSNEITLYSYNFRSKAYEIGMKTYKPNDTMNQN